MLRANGKRYQQTIKNDTQIHPQIDAESMLEDVMQQ